MTVKLKNIEINQIISVLNELANQELKGVRVSYAIAKTIRELTPHNDDLLEARKDLYGKYPEDLTEEDNKKLNKELMDLLNDEVEVSVSLGLNLDAMESAGVNLSPYKMLTIEPLLQDA